MKCALYLRLLFVRFLFWDAKDQCSHPTTWLQPTMKKLTEVLSYFIISEYSHFSFLGRGHISPITRTSAPGVYEWVEGSIHTYTLVLRGLFFSLRVGFFPPPFLAVSYFTTSEIQNALIFLTFWEGRVSGYCESIIITWMKERRRTY